MKTSALIRIIIWSLVIVILTGFLILGIWGVPSIFNRINSVEQPEATAIPKRIQEDAQDTVSATVIANAVNVRSEPASDSSILGVVELNDTVTIYEGREINGQKWLGISSPVAGWMKADYVDSIEDVIFYSADGFDTGSAGTNRIFATATVSQETGIYPTPDETNAPIQSLAIGDTVTVSREEMVNDVAWVYIIAPNSGWVKAEYLTLAENIGEIQLPSVTYSANEISELDIDWVTGTVCIQSADVPEIQITETETSDPKYAMHLKKSGRKLSIQFREKQNNFPIGNHETLSKDLTILVPDTWRCETLDIDAASAELNCTNLVMDEVEIDGASGKCNFHNCQIKELDVDTASGDIFFTGTLNTLDCDAASAHVELLPQNIPSRIDVDSMSGNLGLSLPSSAGFTLKMDTLSGDFISDFACRETGEHSYTCGNGECRINFSSMSGKVIINKGSADSAEHHHTDSCHTTPDSCPDNAPHRKESHHN